MIPVALCADDYALAPGVDRGILALANAGRITALSCMTVSGRWPKAAAALQPLFGRVDIGLHLTLTQLSPLGPMPKLAPNGRFPAMNDIYRLSVMGGIDAHEVQAETERQLRAFTNATGREPDFLDGHHHVHQLSGVRGAVVKAWGARQGWMRNTATPFLRALARGVAVPRAEILNLYGKAARDDWRAAGIATNSDFAGVRNFGESKPYRSLMRAFLKDAAAGLLIMCHPGEPDAELAAIDLVIEPRREELGYLSGPDFPEDLAAAKCELARLSEVLQQSPSGPD